MVDFFDIFKQYSPPLKFSSVQILMFYFLFSFVITGNIDFHIFLVRKSYSKTFSHAMKVIFFLNSWKTGQFISYAMKVIFFLNSWKTGQFISLVFIVRLFEVHMRKLKSLKLLLSKIKAKFPYQELTSTKWVFKAFLNFPSWSRIYLSRLFIHRHLILRIFLF